MDYNYHTHTKRCGHAFGEDEEYVIEAIKEGYQYLGFSDHAMFPFIESEKGMRGDFSELESYIDSINYLKNKYQNQINIYLGMECEYFPCFNEYLSNLLKTKKMHYLILGNHYLECDMKHIYNKDRIYEEDCYIELYANHAIKALNSGLFKIFAHPDLVMWSCKKFDSNWEKYARLMCEAAKNNDVYLEINEAGIRKGLLLIGNELRYAYPYEPFWKIAKEVGNKIIIGVDAHTPDELHSNSHKLALEFANKLGLKIEKNPRIIGG